MTTLIIAVATLFIVGIASYSLFRDSDPFASHRRAMHRAGFTFVSSAPNASTKPKPYEGGGRERLHAEGWEPRTLNLTDQGWANRRRSKAAM